METKVIVIYSVIYGVIIFRAEFTGEGENEIAAFTDARRQCREVFHDIEEYSVTEIGQLIVH
jgi:hypothetical protein